MVCPKAKVFVRAVMVVGSIALAIAGATAGDESARESTVKNSGPAAMLAKLGGTRVAFRVRGLDREPRQPVFIECRGEFAIVHPAGVRFSRAGMGEQGDSPLAAAVLAAREYCAQKESDLSAARGRFYPVLLVRPDGIETYYQVRGALQNYDGDFAYELIDQDWVLELPRHDAELSLAVCHAADEARQRLEQHKKRLASLAGKRIEPESTTPAFELAPAEGREDQPPATGSANIELVHVARSLKQVGNGGQVHIQLKGNRVALVPMEKLVKLFEDDARQNVGRLRDTDEVKNTLGPFDGFYMHYYLGREAVPVKRNGTEMVRAKIVYGFTLSPEKPMLGDLFGKALEEGSDFRRWLKEAEPQRASVTFTFWTYPDSFAAFRELSRKLQELGFNFAVRPLPAGQPIGASSEGNHSSAD